MSPAPTAAQARASASAIVSAWSRPSSWQGPAISVSGRSLASSSSPIRTVLASVIVSSPSGGALTPRAILCWFGGKSKGGTRCSTTCAAREPS